MKNKREMLIVVDRKATFDALDYLAVLKARVEKGEALPEETALAVINGYVNNLRALLG